jgi:hypothetical protein
VGSYFHYAVPGGFDAPQARDITPKAGLFGKSDPMYVVFARKAAAGTAAGAGAAAPAAAAAAAPAASDAGGSSGSSSGTGAV